MAPILAENHVGIAVARNKSERSGKREDVPGPRFSPRRCLVVFSKVPRPGRVKTRLIGKLTAEQAANLHAAFLEDLIEDMGRGRFELRIAWALESEEAPPTCSVQSFVQEGEDLGLRLYQALYLLGREYPLVGAVGSDHPALSVSHIDLAFDKLADGADVVLGPAGDGGYYLVAVRQEALNLDLFEGIPWSSSEVLSTTLHRCQKLELAVALLPTVSDVDTPKDLHRLIDEMERNPQVGGARTRALLRSWKTRVPTAWRGGRDESS